jgi:hypothetical protein
MASFDFLHAIWKNGPGVVSDASDWVLDEIERALPAWMFAHQGDLVGVHVCEQSGLTLGIFVSPSAMGGDGSLEDSRQGSFIHVFATDHPDRMTLGVDEVRELFESVYGEPLSDAAVRQQRSFMLLDFPYHRDLAKDLFINKDRVEGDLESVALMPSDEFEEEHASSSSTDDALYEEDDDRPAPPASLSALLDYRAPEFASAEPDGLPFDQGLPYAEMVARLVERVRSKPVEFEPEHGLGDPPALEPPAVWPSPAGDAWTSPEAPPEVTELDTAAEEEPPSLTPLFGRSAPPSASPGSGVVEVADALPFEASSAVPPAADVGAVEADAAAMDEEETEQLDLRRFAAAPLAERRAPLPARSPRSPTFRLAGLLVAGSLVGGAIVFHLWEPPPADTSLARTDASTVVIPDLSMQRPNSEQAEVDGPTEREVSTGIDTFEIPAPELQAKIVPPAIEATPAFVATEEAKPSQLSNEAAMPPVIDEVETDVLALTVATTQSAPEVASRLEPEPLSPALEPESDRAEADVVAELAPATREDTSSAIPETIPAFPVAITDAPSEQSSTAIPEESAVPRPDERPATSSTGAKDAETPTASERQTNQKDERRRRERKRVMRDFNRYR